MRRREFITLLGGAAVTFSSLAWLRAAHAQPAGKVPRIGFVGLPTAENMAVRAEAFRAGLRALGYVEGQNITIEYRWANEDYDRLPVLCADLVGIKVDAIVTHGTPGVLAAKRATSTIPIVFAVAGDALASGLVSTLARPGGNVTGLTYFNPELAAKRLELLAEAVPGLADVGVLLNPANPMNEPIVPAMRLTAQALKLELHRVPARRPSDLAAAFAALAERRLGALVVLDDPVLVANAPAIAKLAIQQRLPSIGWPDYASRGGLMAYGVDFIDMFRGAAKFVDKILKGAMPSDLPVMRATKFTFIINTQTAGNLGLSLPPTLLARADEVIE
jgi:putative ABC transport system substrate-binding protein